MKYKYWLACMAQMAENIGTGKVEKLFRFAGSARALYDMSEKELMQISGITEADVKSVLTYKKAWNLEEAWENLKRSGLYLVTREDENYPKRLLYINKPPYGIFYKGSLPPEDKKSIAIVGARRCSEYGRYYAKHLAELAVKAGCIIISGLAAGIDGAAHSGAMAAEGETYAVMGCGADYCYPRQNQSLYRTMTQKGGILSEYMPQTKPLGKLFPQRNRLISGLSDVVVVIEAKERSGSLITADFALEQGKDIYALPGRVGDVLSGGCNRLIRQGAGIIVSPEEWFKDLEIDLANIVVSNAFSKKVLEKDEGVVYSVLDLQPKSAQQILEETKLPVDRMCEILLTLENAGFIKEVYKNYYIKMHE